MTNKILWQPQKKHIDKSQMTKFRKYINSKFGYNFLNYFDLYNWSVKYPKEFWHTFLKFSKIKYNGSSHQVCDDFNKMPGAEWFPNVKLNFAELSFKSIIFRCDFQAARHLNLTSLRFSHNFAGIAANPS